MRRIRAIADPCVGARLVKLAAAAIARVRDLIRRAGFDVVRHDAVPGDLAADIRETILAVRPFTLTSVQRIAALCEACRYLSTRGVVGDVVECGVWRGGSMMAVARTLRHDGDAGRTLHLFDTFEGMPPPTEHDVAPSGETAATLLGAADREVADSIWCVAGVDEVVRNMTSTGYDPALVRYVKGKVEDTIPRAAPERIALLRLDTDWYESTRHELVHLFPRLVPGGILILDDYGHWEGAREAVDDYIREHRLKLYLQRIDYSGRLAVKISD